MDFSAIGSCLAVFLDALKSLAGPRRARPCNVPLLTAAADPTTSGVPVYVMLPLDATQRTCLIDLSAALDQIARAGATGIMVDVWWGLCEKQPGVYDFDQYRMLAQRCKQLGLLMQATMSFHACGGNVGDTVNIPLPDWVIHAGDQHNLWYMDRQGHKDRECLNLAADLLAVLPAGPTDTSDVTSGQVAKTESSKQALSPASGALSEQADVSNACDADGRSNPTTQLAASKTDEAPLNRNQQHMPELADTTAENATSTALKTAIEKPAAMRSAIETYKQYVSAFLDAMGPDLVGSTVVELQIGCGPCGELRYPSYPLADGMWAFPGMGELQCFDPHMLESLSSAASAAGHPSEWGQVPTDTGTYNAAPHSSKFFSQGLKTARGKFFLMWYADALLDHGRRMIEAVSAVTSRYSGLALAVKISGIHWWKFSYSRAAEATAGYYICREYNSYEKIAALFREKNIILDFTCLEMRTIDQPFLKARCGPYQLVKEVFEIARKTGVRVAGENALERYDWLAYQQIMKAFRPVPQKLVHGFTMLRLGQTLLESENIERFSRFASSMKRIHA